jgi:hypothetical protein
MRSRIANRPAAKFGETKYETRELKLDQSAAVLPLLLQALLVTIVCLYLVKEDVNFSGIYSRTSRSACS